MISKKKTENTATLPVKVGRVRVVAVGENLGIRFSLDYKDYRVGKLGIISSENIKLATAKAQAIDSDISLQCFDPTLAKYTDVSRHSQSQSVAKKLAVQPQTTSLDLIALWDKFVSYKVSNTVKSNTIAQYEAMRKLYAKIDINSIGLDALTVKMNLQTITTDDQMRRALLYLSAMCDFGIRFNLIASNPFKGMSAECASPNYAVNPTPKAFSQDEMIAVIDAFKSSDKYSHYAALVEFWMLTGCRPSEAIGLQWKAISDDFTVITFNGSIQYCKGQLVREIGSKNNKSRQFPCNQALQALLKAMKPSECNGESLVFASPRNGTINYNNFQKRAWPTVDTIKPDTTPYSCRDTFISLQLLKGTPSAVIAKWCDTSTTMIDKYYTDSSKFLAVLPK